MDEQDYKSLISVYQTKLFDQINQNVALEARELKYRQTIEVLTKKIEQLEAQPKVRTRKSTKTEEEFS